MKFFYVILIILISPLISQDDLLEMLDDDPNKSEFVESAFKGTRVVNAQSLEIPKPKIFKDPEPLVPT